MPNAEWKIQIMQPEYGMYLSSYVNMTSQTWTTTFFYKDEELGRGVWGGDGNNQTNSTSDEDSNIPLKVHDLTGPEYGSQYVHLSHVTKYNHTV